MDNQNLTQDPSSSSAQNPTPPQSSIIENSPPLPPQQAQPTNPNPTPPDNEPNKNNNSNALIAVLLLLFVYPIGLIYMWTATKWPKWLKLLLSIPVLLIFIGIFIAIFTGVIGTLNYSKNNVSNNNFKTPPKPTPISIDQIDNRIINNDGGYSFVLPKPWKAKISSYSKTTTIFGESFLNDLGIGQIDVTDNNKSLTDALNHQTKGQYSEPTPITVDGIPGVTEDFKSVVQGKVVIVYKDGKTYGISILSNNAEDLKKFQEIISSFKFIQ